jgi:Ribosomal protein L1p/L10e family
VRKYFKAFKDLKSLITQHSHFICDANIMTQLYNLLGKTFSNHKQPIPVAYISPEKLSLTLTAAVSATYMKMKGKTISIRIGLTSMSPEDVIANALQGLEAACLLFDNAWDNVRCINLATSNSPSLPIYNKIPTALSAYVNESNSSSSTETKMEVTSGKKRKASEKIDETVPAVVVKGKKGKATITKEVVVAPAVTETTVEVVVKKTRNAKKVVK